MEHFGWTWVAHPRLPQLVSYLLACYGLEMRTCGTAARESSDDQWRSLFSLWHRFLMPNSRRISNRPLVSTKRRCRRNKRGGGAHSRPTCIDMDLRCGRARSAMESNHTGVATGIGPAGILVDGLSESCAEVQTDGRLSNTSLRSRVRSTTTWARRRPWAR
jgi:hypothetical protein